VPELWQFPAGIFGAHRRGGTLTDDPPLTQEVRRQRVVLLCCNFMRNLAFHRAGLRYAAVRDYLLNPHHPLQGEFWIQAHGNFLDACVLDWCMLFGDRKHGKHHWRRVVDNPDVFETDLRTRLGVTPAEFDEVVEKITHYRDKFLAHRDEEQTMILPQLEIARKAVLFLDEHLAQQLADEWRGLPAAAEQRASEQDENVYAEAVDAARRL
jgi:hypothetical protein